MSKKLYIAYGSNLNLKQMKYRCPTAKLVGKGIVENYELQFKGMPHCSYATIAPCIGKSVPVALWELQPRDERLLDRYEGYPSHYFKQDLPVKLNNGLELTAMVYIMNLKQDFGLPSASYYDTVSQGYKVCGFDSQQLIWLRIFTRKIIAPVEVNLLKRQSFSMWVTCPQTTTVSIFLMWLPLH